MSFFKELIHRRIPQIIGSYLIAGTSLILFVDWLVNRYSLPEYYTTLSLFGIITIIPSVFIIAYFHGAPGKDEWNKIEKIGIPVNIIFIFFVLLIGHKSSWWFKSEHVIENNNYYVNFTSSEDYLKYYDNYDTPFDMRFSSDRYLIKSVSDSIIDEIKFSVYRSVSSEYAGQGISIDVNFTKEENEAFDQLFHPVLASLTDSEKDTLSIKMDKIVNILDKNYIHYDGHLPNTIIRYFIYDIADLETNESYYSYQTTSHWGESMRTHSSTQYTGWSKKYFFSDQGLKKIIEDLSNSLKDKVKQRKYSGGMGGEVIEELDHGLVRIKQSHPGTIRKKMRLKSMRQYVWEEDGLNIMLDDYMQLVDYLKNTDSHMIWKYGQSRPDGEWANKLNEYDETEFQKEIDESISLILEHIQELRDKEKTGYYKDTNSIDTDLFEYFLEVISIEDSIVIAKIIGSRHPVYNVRKGDWVLISQ